MNTARHAGRPETAPPPVAAPVFVDASGRRHRRVRRVVTCVLVAATAYVVAVVVSFLGGPVPPKVLLPLPGVPGKLVATDTPVTPTAGPGGSQPAPSAPETHAAAVKPSAAASPSLTGAASPSSTRRVPPGQAGRSASPGSGHGR